MANRPTHYTCERCRKACEEFDAPGTLGALLLALQLCEPCQAKRYAAGLEQQRKAAAS